MADTGNNDREPSIRSERSAQYPSPAEDLSTAASADVVGAEAVQGGEHHQQQQQQHTQNPPHPPFQPIFTLLTNSTTNTTAHPRVRYLFSDDDDASTVLSQARSDPSTCAILVDLAPPSAASHPGPAADPSPSSSSTTSKLETGHKSWSISWASSLTPDFAVTDSSLVPQRSEGDSHHHHHPGSREGERDEEDAPALMLRIEGVEREPVDLAPDSSLPSSGSASGAATAAAGKEDVDGLMDEFKRRMAVLDKVVAEGEKRRGVFQKERQGSEQRHGGDDAQEAVGEVAVEGAEEVSHGRST